MNDLQSSQPQPRKSLMWLSFGVLYLMLALAVVILLALENNARLKVVGSVFALLGFFLLTLLVIGWCRQKRTLGMPLPDPTLSFAPTKTRLPFRIMGIALAIPLLVSGGFFLSKLGIDWSDSLKEPVLSLVIAAMGLSSVIVGSLFGYCCLTGKEWPGRSVRH